MTVFQAVPSTDSDNDGLITREQAAKYVGVHVDTLRKWVRRGTFRIPLPGKGKEFRFSRAMIDEWVAKRALYDSPPRCITGSNPVRAPCRVPLHVSNLLISRAMTSAWGRKPGALPHTHS
jgi:excisionase family DNA binding protein